MNVYTSEAVQFFELVLASGLIAVFALTIASLIGFTVTHLVFRERVDARQQAGARSVSSTVADRPRAPAAPAYVVSSPVAVAR